MNEHVVVTVAAIGVLAIACQWLAWWVKLPAILLLLVAGVVVGPVLGWLDPNAVFGDLLFPIVSLSVAVILFEGSLTLRFAEIAGLERVVRRLVTTGVVVTWLITALVVRTVLEFPWELCFLFGAITVVTGPTVIVPMLRTVRPTAHVSNILRWEGIVIDPVGALLAVLVYEFILAGGTAFSHTLMAFGRIVVAGVVLGVGMGYLLGTILRRHWLPEYLHNVATLNLVFAVFAAANEIQEESGLLAVTVMGIWLANMKNVPVEDILNFKESLSVLLISGLFIILAARVDFDEVRMLGWSALLVFLGIQLLARPLKVLISTHGSSLSWRERLILGWIAPRGIVAAAVAAVFAIRLADKGYEQAPLLVPLTFIVIIGTVVLQSATARGIARLLGVAEPEPRGFLIVGANPVARLVGRALDKQGFPALLTDTSWDYVRAGLMESLRVYYGNPVSEHADRHLDLVGIGRLLALSPQRELNALAALRYRAEFGAKNIYTLLSDSAKKGNSEKRHVTPKVGNIAFGEDVNYVDLLEQIRQGAEIRDTRLTETFTHDDYYKTYFQRATPLFAIDPRGRLRVYSATSTFEPVAGWTILGLVSAEASEQPAPPPEEADDAGEGSS